MGREKIKRFFPVLFVAALLIAAILSPFASALPDGLERVAIDLGFIDKGEGDELVASPLADYAVPAVSGEKFSTALAGIIGTLLVFGCVYFMAGLLRRNGLS